jgi:hypothetical protein
LEKKDVEVNVIADMPNSCAIAGLGAHRPRCALPASTRRRRTGWARFRRRMAARSAFALLRSVFEAYVRGEWIALRADETWANRFLEGKELRPEAVGRPQNSARAVPERIAFSLEGKIARQLPHIESILLEPFAKPRLFGAPLAVQEMPKDHVAAEDESAVGGENQIRERRARSHHRGLGHLRQHVEILLPLRGRPFPIGAMDIPLHPRVDDVLDSVMFRRTDQESSAAGHERTYSRQRALAILLRNRANLAILSRSCDRPRHDLHPSSYVVL